MQKTVIWILALLVIPSAANAEAQGPPNILWIIVDDMSTHFSSYGERLIKTPHVDQLASRGVQFNRAFVTAPVCSTCRSAFITGMYQTSIGAHHHRSGRGTEKIHLPEPIRPLPEMFREAGYYTTISGWPIRPNRLGKTDYNFQYDPKMYDGADWASRREGQPFFAQIQLAGGKLRGGTTAGNEAFVTRVEEKFGGRVKPEDVVLPPYYPRTDVILKDWAAYLDSVRETDHVVGNILDRLKAENVFENTVVIFMTDHGLSHVRGKQFMYDEGLHVPLVIAGPGIPVGKQRNDLVEHIDIAPVSLALAGIEIPAHMQAQDILAKNYKPRDAVFAARDRCDETVEHMRSVRTQKYKYIRNYLDQRPHLQPNAYKDHKSIVIAFKEAGASGKLNEIQKQLLTPTRPKQELYDLDQDAYEIHNLADDPAYKQILRKMQHRLANWEEETGDQGRDPEPAVIFDSDMKVYVDKLEARGNDPKRIIEIKANIQLMKKWAAQEK